MKVRKFPERKTHLRYQKFDYIGRYVYFLTICTFKKQRYFINASVVDNARNILIRSSEKHKFAIIAYCFMPEHLHLMVGGLSDNSDLKKFVTDFKRVTSYDFMQKNGGRLWQRSYYDRIVRNNKEYDDTVRYIIHNPVNAYITDDYMQYQFSFFCKEYV